MPTWNQNIKGKSSELLKSCTRAGGLARGHWKLKGQWMQSIYEDAKYMCRDSRSEEAHPSIH